MRAKRTEVWLLGRGGGAVIIKADESIRLDLVWSVL